jgi:hypothetical protein
MRRHGRRWVRATINSARKRRLFSRNDRTVCVGADNSEHCRGFKEMIFHFAHQSSNPTTATESVSAVGFPRSTADLRGALYGGGGGESPDNAVRSLSVKIRRLSSTTSRCGWCDLSASTRCANMPKPWSTRRRVSTARRHNRHATPRSASSWTKSRKPRTN